MSKRHVSVSTLFSLFNGKKPFGYIGFILLILSIFVLLPGVLTLNSNIKAPHEKYDQQAIAKNGVVKDAVITSVSSLDNVTVNGRHPVLISYNYTISGNTISDQFETMNIDKAATLSPGSNIKIKVYNGESAIEGFVPYSFLVAMFL